jgi:small subunit ribosomal protein S17
MMNTVVVLVSTRKRHPKYKKAYSVSKKYKAHSENNEYKVGERVIIEACRPISKHKRFKVIGKA